MEGQADNRSDKGRAAAPRWGGQAAGAGAVAGWPRQPLDGEGKRQALAQWLAGQGSPLDGEGKHGKLLIAGDCCAPHPRSMSKEGESEAALSS